MAALRHSAQYRPENDQRQALEGDQRHPYAGGNKGPQRHPAVKASLFLVPQVVNERIQQCKHEYDAANFGKRAHDPGRKEKDKAEQVGLSPKHLPREQPFGDKLTRSGGNNGLTEYVGKNDLNHGGVPEGGRH